jgi:MFS family permease
MVGESALSGEPTMSSNGVALAESTAREHVRTQNLAALKYALAGLAGASIEWYDFFLYATAAALVFPSIFFPAAMPPFVALSASFSTFAVGFLMRPVGAVLFGHIGDRHGRKVAFAIALILMGTATALIGLLPSYRTAGVFSPLALVLLRLAQGIAVGGQWGGAVLLATENSPTYQRGFYGSIPQAGVSVGVVLANLGFIAASGAMSNQAFMAYGWRIPFLFSVALIGFGLYLRFRVEDTAAFRHLDPCTAEHAAANCAAAGSGSARSPVIDAIRLHSTLILRAGGSYVSTVLLFYILITYVVAFGTSASGLHLPRATLLNAVLISTIVQLPAVFLAGLLSDRYGRRRIFMTGIALAGAWAFVLFPLIETRSFVCITVALGVATFFLSLTAGPMAAMFAEQFAAPIRYSAISLSYQTAAIIGGGLAPVIATALYARFHSNLGVSLYIAGACAVSLVCAGTLKVVVGSRRVEESVKSPRL